ncbi:MAG: hydroxylamine reductase [Armatimonadota bacterium]
MFCYQCEQAAQGRGCTAFGNCGKDSDVAALQDLLVYAVKGISAYAHRGAVFGARDRDVDVFVLEALFSTVTNVNFDPTRIHSLIRKAAQVKERAKQLYTNACRSAGIVPEMLDGPAAWTPDAEDVARLLELAADVSIPQQQVKHGTEACSLRELILYGLKGAAAYAYHAVILGKEDPALYAGFHELMSRLGEHDLSLDELVQMALRVGQLNLRAMELLDAGNTESFGHPEPTAVRVTPVRGKAILVSGHDLKDLHDLLRQTEGSGINVYTHGEMLPAHGYPKLLAYKHLVGNYGGAWQDQLREFSAFPGAILMTTNCIQRPSASYKERMFTSGLVGWPGVRHIGDGNFWPVIEAALSAPGFQQDEPEQTVMVGFGRNAVLSSADKIVRMVKSGDIRRFFLIGGCDGAKPGRNYYTELAQAIPPDCVILTLACGKYRFNRLDLGKVDGLPRLLDIGQCNDAYSAVQIALALADALGCEVNDLPLSLVLSWYEQKAVAILLTLLYLGVKNIRLGPSLPAFVTPSLLETLSRQFGLRPIASPQQDLQEMLG